MDDPPRNSHRVTRWGRDDPPRNPLADPHCMDYRPRLLCRSLSQWPSSSRGLRCAVPGKVTRCVIPCSRRDLSADASRRATPLPPTTACPSRQQSPSLRRRPAPCVCRSSIPFYGRFSSRPHTILLFNRLCWIQCGSSPSVFLSPFPTPTTSPSLPDTFSKAHADREKCGRSCLPATSETR